MNDKNGMLMKKIKKKTIICVVMTGILWILVSAVTMWGADTVKTASVPFLKYGNQTVITTKDIITLKPRNQGRNITYTSSDRLTAVVSAKGKLTPLKKGRVTITCTSYGKYKYVSRIKVTIVSPVENVVTEDEIFIKKGQKINWNVRIYPLDAKANKVVYTSDNTKIVSVDSSGKICAKAVGKAVITVTVVGGRKITAKSTVYVSDSAAKAEHSLEKNTKYIIHRGESAFAPENTIPAFEEAGKRGVSYVETDVRETKDGRFVISHDSSLFRVCGVDKEIKDMTYEEIRQYPVIHGANISEYPGCFIPSFEEYIQCCNKYGITPVIELKEVRTEEGKEMFCNILKHSLKPAVVTSFHKKYLTDLRSLGVTNRMQ